MQAFFKALAAAAIGGFATGMAQALSANVPSWKHALTVGAVGAISTVAALFTKSPTQT